MTTDTSRAEGVPGSWFSPPEGAIEAEAAPSVASVVAPPGRFWDSSVG